MLFFQFLSHFFLKFTTDWLPLLGVENFPFICSDCGKGFNNKYKLNSHEKKHEVCRPASGKQLKPEMYSVGLFQNFKNIYF